MVLRQVSLDLPLGVCVCVVCVLHTSTAGRVCTQFAAGQECVVAARLWGVLCWVRARVVGGGVAARVGGVLCWVRTLVAGGGVAARVGDVLCWVRTRVGVEGERVWGYTGVL